MRVDGQFVDRSGQCLTQSRARHSRVVRTSLWSASTFALGEAMRRSSRSRSGYAVAKSLVAAIALCMTALVATTGITGAEVVAQKQPKIDKNAVLRFAL